MRFEEGQWVIQAVTTIRQWHGRSVVVRQTNISPGSFIALRDDGTAILAERRADYLVSAPDGIGWELVDDWQLAVFCMWHELELV